ncbi:MAG: Lrp/AsnC family transcriptional regulator [Gammaproteobacteria bacterium]|jgi:Lrp/AsnC family transcriptional regulator
MHIDLSSNDKKILQLLQDNASLSTAEIAEKVGLSQSPCWRRISRMEQAGIIKKRVAVLDHAKLGMEVVVFVNVSLTTHGRQNLVAFEKEITKFPEVLECYTVTGQMDYLLKIITKDIQHYESFIRNKLMTLPMIREMHSTIAITEIKDTTALPLETQI